MAYTPTTTAGPRHRPDGEAEALLSSLEGQSMSPFGRGQVHALLLSVLDSGQRVRAEALRDRWAGEAAQAKEQQGGGS